MSLHKYTRVGYYDFRAGEKLWDEFPKWEDHNARFYDMELVITRYEYDKTRKCKYKSGFLSVTFSLACTHKVSFYNSMTTRHAIFQRQPHDLRTATWRKTADSVISFDPDFDGPDNDVADAYKNIMRRIKLGEFSK